MKTTDLMIGDWVICHHPTMPEDYVQITACWLNTMERIEHGLVKEDSCLYRIFKPIPLTPEILEKNGWKHKYYGIYRQTIGEAVTIDIFPEGCSVEDERGSQCFYRLRYHLPALKFVHELQHALRLCGIEKEIEL